jgi:hypothetical protein
METDKKGRELRLGIVVLIVLAALTAMEFIAARYFLDPVLWIILLVKASLVVWFYMHIKRVFNPEDGE